MFGLGMVLISIFGCTAPTQKFVRTENNYIYDKILVMPFSRGDEKERTLVYTVFLQELEKFADIQVFGKEQFEEHLLKDLNLSEDQEYSLDQFAAGTQGKERLEAIDKSLGAKAIIFGTISVGNSKVYLAIKMLNVESGSLTLSFSKEEDVLDNNVEEALKAVTKECAQKVINHIKDNVTITNIYKYQ